MESQQDSTGAACDQLLTSASQIMRDGDVVDISLSELSLRSGLNSALVKYYFGNKQGLMLALLERDMGNIVHGLEALLAKDMAPADMLRHHVGATIDTFYTYPYLNRLLMRMIRDCPPAEATKIADLFLKPIYKFYRKLIERGVASGEFRKVDPQLFYFTVTGVADRFFSARLVLRHCFDEQEMTEEMRDSYREHTIDIIMAGILAPGSEIKS